MKIRLIVAATAALLVRPAWAEILYYTDQGAFEQHNLAVGKTLKGVENFEESEAEDGLKYPFPNPLQNGVPRPTFPNGIDATNLIIQTNITLGACPPAPNPSDADRALWVNGAGFIGSNSIKVGTDEFLYARFSSLDLIFTTDDKTAVGLDVSTYDGFNQGHDGFVFCVYDVADNILGSYTISGATPPEPSKNFFGVWSDVPIGRVNIWGVFGVPQPFAIDNIQMWVVPEPSSAILLAACALFAVRTRRRAR